MELSKNHLDTISKFIEDKTGISISDGKHYLIEHRTKALMEKHKISSIQQLLCELIYPQRTDAVNELIDMVTTNETFWFRDKSTWDFIENFFLPKIISETREGKRKNTRIWSCACSTGQEPYSLAICIDMYLNTRNIKDVSLDNFYIEGSDISDSSLNNCIQGMYDHISMDRGLDKKIKGIYFKKNNEIWSILPIIKSSVNFRKRNLSDLDSYPDGWDLILCRNVLIYFSDTMKQKVLDSLKRSLKPTGILLVGSAEILNDYYKNIISKNFNDSVYYCKE